MLQSQLEDCLTREEKLTEKYKKRMEREDEVLKKLDEISSRQASTERGSLLQRSSTVGNTILNQSAKCVKDDITEYVSQNRPNRAFQNQFAWNSTEVMNYCWTYPLSSGRGSLYAVLVDSLWSPSQKVDALLYLYKSPSRKSGFLHTNKCLLPYVMSMFLLQ